MEADLLNRNQICNEPHPNLNSNPVRRQLSGARGIAASPSKQGIYSPQPPMVSTITAIDPSINHRNRNSSRGVPTSRPSSNRLNGTTGRANGSSSRNGSSNKRWIF